MTGEANFFSSAMLESCRNKCNSPANVMIRHQPAIMRRPEFLKKKKSTFCFKLKKISLFQKLFA